MPGAGDSSCLRAGELALPKDWWAPALACLHWQGHGQQTVPSAGELSQTGSRQPHHDPWAGTELTLLSAGPSLGISWGHDKEQVGGEIYPHPHVQAAQCPPALTAQTKANGLGLSLVKALQSPDTEDPLPSPARKWAAEARAGQGLG